MENPKEENIIEEEKPENLREADEIAQEIDSWRTRSFALIRRTRITTLKGAVILAFIAGIVAAVIWLVSFNIQINTMP